MCWEYLAARHHRRIENVEQRRITGADQILVLRRRDVEHTFAHADITRHMRGLVRAIHRQVRTHHQPPALVAHHLGVVRVQLEIEARRRQRFESEAAGEKDTTIVAGGDRIDHHRITQHSDGSLDLIERDSRLHHPRLSLVERELSGELRMIERSRKLERGAHLTLEIRDVIAEDRRDEFHRHAVAGDVERDLTIVGESRSGHAGEREIDRHRPLSNQKCLRAGTHRLGAATQRLVGVLDVAVHFGDCGAVVEQIRRAERALELRVLESAGGVNVHVHQAPRVDVALCQRNHIGGVEIVDGDVKKGDVLGIARIAAIMGAKRTSDLVPLCHPLPITRVAVDFEVDAANNSVHCRAQVETVDLDAGLAPVQRGHSLARPQTGVELQLQIIELERVANLVERERSIGRVSSLIVLIDDDVESAVGLPICELGTDAVEIEAGSAD